MQQTWAQNLNREEKNHTSSKQKKTSRFGCKRPSGSEKKVNNKKHIQTDTHAHTHAHTEHTNLIQKVIHII